MDDVGELVGGGGELGCGYHDFFNAEGARLMIFERERGDLFSDFGYLNSGTGDGGDDRIGGNLSVRN